MKWTTRERPKINRLAWPWLIKRFIEVDAEARYVAADGVVRLGASVTAGTRRRS